MAAKFILMEACNFIDFPVGGGLSFSRQLMRVYKNNVALVGMTTDPKEPVGHWFKKKIDGVEYDYFAAYYKVKSTRKSLIPVRLFSCLALYKNLGHILTYPCNNIFTGCPQYMLVLRRNKLRSICYCFAGTANSVGNSRYKFLQIFGEYYENKLFSSLSKNADVILAAADQRDIELLAERSHGFLPLEKVHHFPTRVDTKIFYPQSQNVVREQLGISKDLTVFVVSGRLSWVKGWEFLLSAFKKYLSLYGSAKLFFLGGGEDETKIHNYIEKNFNANEVDLRGIVSSSELSLWLNAANTVLCGSFFEGWPTSMVEALSCGRPLVSTDVGGASDMVHNGKNGFVLKERDPEEFAHAMYKACHLPGAATYSYNISHKYSVNKLAIDLELLWPVIAL